MDWKPSVLCAGAAAWVCGGPARRRGARREAVGGVGRWALALRRAPVRDVDARPLLDVGHQAAAQLAREGDLRLLAQLALLDGQRGVDSRERNGHLAVANLARRILAAVGIEGAVQRLVGGRRGGHGELERLVRLAPSQRVILALLL